MTRKRVVSRVVWWLLIVFVLLSSISVKAQSDQFGQWTTLTTLPFFPVHDHLLPTGQVMIWPGDAGISGNDPRLWNPADQSVTTLAKPGYDLFCSGHAFLADGRLFVAGGHIQNGVGLPKASLYDPFSNAWAAAPDMNAGRWYPTVTTLANGDALVVSGVVDNTVGVNTLPQVYQTATGTWRSLTSAQLSVEAYPMMFLAPNGKVFHAAPSQITRYLDTSGTGAWSFVADRTILTYRDYGSAVMYADGKILVLGGGDPPTNTAEVIDLNQPSPTWRSVASMSIARRQANATLLPDGTVLVTGGTSGAGFNDATNPVYPAELWDPATESWRTLAGATVPRLYHSAAVLLPDGRVLSTGGNDYPTPEAFSPPYLFKGARPTMSAVPSTIGYGQPFSVQTADAASITKVTLIRITSVTHAFNQNQRLSALSFTPGSGTLDIVAPATANVAPPGHYLLFIVNGNNVPSVGSIVQLGAAAPAATLTSLSPSSAVAGGPAFTLTVNGTGFVNGATVRWNGQARTTTFVSGSQLTAAITASDIGVAGTMPVTVVNPGASASNALTFTITTPPAATLTSLSPSSAAAGGAAFTLTVNGTGFVSGATVQWNGVARTTTLGSSTQLTAAIPASDIAVAGTSQVTVVNPGASASNALTFTTTSAPPDTQPPTAPSNLTATAVSGSQINLSWTASTDTVGVTGYRVERCQGATCTNFVQIATPPGASYADTGLAASTTYRYQVRATDAAGNLSGYSNVASATTPGGSPGLVAAYGFDEGTGSTTADASGNGNMGAITNATWTASGKFGSALVFNGSTALVTIADAASLDLTTGMTLMAWVKPSTITTEFRQVVSKGYNAYGLYGTTPTNGGAPAVNANVPGGHAFIEAPSALTVDVWAHLAATYDGTTARLYVNGTQVASVAAPVPGSINTTTGSLTIGAAPGYEYFAGTVDEVRVYNVALTATQIQADMNTPVAGGGTPDTQPPTAPSGLTFTAVSASQINLSWTASTDTVGVTGYRVERCQGAGCTNFAQIGTPTAASFTDPGVAASTTYRYQVRATDAAGNLSGYSNVASATTPAASDTQPPTAPSNLTATAVSGSQINLSWTASTDTVGVTGYRVERCQGATCTNFVQIGTSSGPSFSSTGLLANTRYRFRVQAVDAAVNPSPYSNVAAARTSR